MNKKSNLFVYIFLAIGIVMLSITSTLAFLMDVDKGEGIMKFGKVSLYADGKGSEVQGEENIKSMLHAELINESFGRDDAIVTEDNKMQVAVTKDSADCFIKVRFSYVTTDEALNQTYADTLAAMTNSGVPAGLNLFHDTAKAYKYYTHTDGWSYLVYDNAETEVDKTLKVAGAGEVFVITADYKLTYDTVVGEAEVVSMFEVVEKAEASVHLVCEVKAIQAEGAREADVLAAEGEATILGAAEAAYGNATIYDFARIELENEGIVNEIGEVVAAENAQAPAEGVVKMAGNRIVLTDMIAGEGIKFNFEVENEKAEKQIRLGVLCENDGGLLQHLVIGINGVETKGFNAYSDFVAAGPFEVTIKSTLEPVVEEPEEGEGEVLAAAEVAEVKTAELILVVEAVEPERAVAQNIVQVSTVAEWQALAGNINIFSGKTIEIVADLDFEGAELNPIVLQKGKNIVINGKGHKISDFVVTNGATEPKAGAEIGDGASCYYQAGFIADNQGTMEVKNLTFVGAKVQIQKPADGVMASGSSQIGVVCGRNNGILTLTNINVKSSEVLGYNKLGALVGHNMKNAQLTVNRCTVAETTIKFDDLYEATNGNGYPEYKEGSFAGALAGYNQGKIVLNGLKVETLTINIDNIDKAVNGAWVTREFEDYEGVYGTIITDTTHYMYMLYSKLGCQACEAVEMQIGNYTFALEEIAIPTTRMVDDFLYNN